MQTQNKQTNKASVEKGGGLSASHSHSLALTLIHECVTRFKGEIFLRLLLFCLWSKNYANLFRLVSALFGVKPADHQLIYPWFGLTRVKFSLGQIDEVSGLF